MIPPRAFPRSLAIVIPAIALSAAFAAGEDLSSAERLGFQIYAHGKGAAPVEAFLGDGREGIAASVVPCASCHGPDGRGRPEGGIVPANITPAALGAAAEAGWPRPRRRDAYSERSLKRAIAMGIDSSGNRLNATMPRYQMSAPDMDALIAYLKRVGDVYDPGITPESIRIGVLLPPKQPLPGINEAVRRVLQAFFDGRNRSGETFERKIEVVFTDCDASSVARAAAAAKFIAEQKPFALIDSFPDGADDEIAALAAEKAIPLLAISAGARSDPSNRYVRHLVAGLRDQARALAHFAGRRFPKAHVAVLHERGEQSTAVADGAAQELRTLSVDVTLAESSVAPAALKERGIDVLLFVGASETLAKLMAVAQMLDWRPVVLVPGALIHPDLLDRRRSSARVYIALPIGPNDQTAEAVAAWRGLVGDEGQPHQPSQFAALATAQLLIAALERAGRDLTRDRLLAAIDGMSAFETGLVPALTFTRTRHVGSTGATIVAVTDDVPDEQRMTWIDPG